MIACVKFAGDGNESLCEVGMNAPVTCLVGIGQSAARYGTANAHVIELVALRTQARFDVAQALTIGHLGKGHAQILVKTDKLLHLPVTAITRHTAPECVQGQMARQLRKNQFANVHASSSNDRTKHLEA